MFSYIAYGLGINSVLPLPELIAKETTTDVVVRLGKVDYWQQDTFKIGNYIVWSTPKEIGLFNQRVGAFLVRNGREIIIDPVPDVNKQLLGFAIQEQALALLLHQRGFLLLHASAVAVNDSVVAFLGASGQGKSTTAAALQAQGYDLLTDDLLVLEVGGTGSPMVLPGFPQSNLWPEAASALGYVPEMLPRIHPYSEKRARYSNYNSPQKSLPLRCIYVIDEGSGYEIEPLQPQQAFVELVKHSYGIQVLHHIEKPAAHLHQWADLIDKVSISRLRRSRSLSKLPYLVKFIEEDLSRIIPNYAPIRFS